MKTIIKLGGILGRKFGRTHERYLDTGTTKEAMNALRNTIDGFQEFIMAKENEKQEYAVFKNGKNIKEDEFDIAGAKEIRIIPIVAGSKRGGIFNVVLGAVLIVVGVVFPPAAVLVKVGAGLAIAGAISMLVPQPKQPKLDQDAENSPSYGFGGPISATASGQPNPVLFGQREVGGIYLSASITNYDI